jgi:hypothetical protein
VSALIHTVLQAADDDAGAVSKKASKEKYAADEDNNGTRAWCCALLCAHTVLCVCVRSGEIDDDEGESSSESFKGGDESGMLLCAVLCGVRRVLRVCCVHRRCLRATESDAANEPAADESEGEEKVRARVVILCAVLAHVIVCACVCRAMMSQSESIVKTLPTKNHAQ